MRASVGDRLVLASSVVDGAVRDGMVVELRHDDGSPPYVVEWLDTGERTLVFPGPDAYLEHSEDTGPTTGRTVSARTWRVQLTVSHEGAETTAQAVLVAGTPDGLGAVGRARRNPEDGDVPEIGDEVAVARALRRLADRLTDTAEDQIEDSTGRPARVHG